MNTAVETKSISIATKAEKLEITTPEQFHEGCSVLNRIAALEKEVEDTFKSSQEKTNAAHKEVVAAKNRHLDPLTKAKKLVKSRLEDYFVGPVGKDKALTNGTGFSFTTRWKAEMVDLQKLVKAAAKNKDLLCYLKPNSAALDKTASAMQKAFNVPGFKAVSTPSSSFRKS